MMIKKCLLKTYYVEHDSLYVKTMKFGSVTHAIIMQITWGRVSIKCKEIRKDSWFW